MKRASRLEFYIGALVWCLSVVIAFSFWVKGDAEIVLPLTTSNASIAGLLFAIYFAGYSDSHGIFSRNISRTRKAIGMAIAAIAAGLLSSVFFVFGMIGCMFMMLIVQLSTLTTRVWASLAAVLTPSVLVYIDYLFLNEFEFANVALFAVVNLLALATSYRALSEEQAKRRSEQLVRELKATQALLSAASKRDERLRIARNLHDVLGHQLTALSLQLEVASHVSGEVKQTHIANAKEISKNLLSNVRDTVSEFREGQNSGLEEALTTLVKDIPNLEISLTFNWNESLASDQQIEVMFRCVQEALTNIMKHSSASHCAIEISSDDHSSYLRICDNGNVDQAIVPGNGLTGLQERARLLNGKLQYQGNQSGFSLSVNLPLGEQST